VTEVRELRERVAGQQAALKGTVPGAAFRGRFGLQGSQHAVDLFGGAEMLRSPAQPGLAGGVAGVEELAVQPLENLPLDHLPIAEPEVGQAGVVPAAWRLAALLRRRQVIPRSRFPGPARLCDGADLPPRVGRVMAR
jgi:hypothetical protein